MEATQVYIPNKVLFDHTLPAGARLLYGVILTEALATGYCYSTNQELGDSICLSAKSISRNISMLVERGLLSREIMYDPKTKEVTGRRLYPQKSELAALASWRKNRCQES